MQNDKTLDYYNQNADSFIEGTIGVDFEETQRRFIDKLEQGDYILDFGCGSGRDTKYFLSKGFQVDALDGSKELCRKAQEYTGIEVWHMLFQELEEEEKYHGIWACASILHLKKEELKPVFKKMLKALKNNGLIYCSFKCSDFEGLRKGRYFTDFTLESFREFIVDLPELKIEEHWVTGDVRIGREQEKWLNLLLRKEIA